jgi:beta-hydroxylase
MAPYNCFAYLFSRVPNRPVQDVRRFPELLKLGENWEAIRDEAVRLYEAGHLRASEGGTRFYLKWYDEAVPSAAEGLCPKTVGLVRSLRSVNAAQFAVLPGRSRVGSRREAFAGSLRYHLGLKTPNSGACRMYLDGEAYAWRDGADGLFDETYVHSVKNDTDEVRVVLLCDVERPMWPVARGVNRFVARQVARVAAAQDVPTEKVGWVSRCVCAVKAAGERLKERHRAVYRVVRYGFTAGLLAGGVALFLW